MIVVTGATGHLGNVLVRTLVSRGAAVKAMVLPGEDCKALQGVHVETVTGNVLDPDSLDKAFKGAEKVFHMAGLVNIAPGKEAVMHQVNVEGTKNVLKAAQKAGVKRLVYTSSIHALGRPPKGVVVDERIPFDTHNTAGTYDVTKALASEAVKKAAEAGQDAVIVCPTGVIGPFDFRRSEMGELVLSWMTRQLSWLVRGKYDFVDVRDVAEGHILAAEKGGKGEVYILSGTQIEISHFRDKVQEFAGLHSPKIILPLGLVMMVTPLTALYYRMARTRPLFTRYSMETLQSNSNISSQKAERELGYRRRPIYDTLKDTVAWWLEHRHSIKSTLRGA
ncbi:MAG TPA: SDR family oxidoreductase [Anaerolineaceae bacterium]|nr:SDR family oxidoreductase [Anaerolineaceae bacterium]HPN52841.1 SDR family oxidoreductase [Anaerolineaceae bacterium]